MIIKGPKYPSLGCNFGPKLKPHVDRSAKKHGQQFRPYIQKSMTYYTKMSGLGRRVSINFEGHLASCNALEGYLIL